MSNDIETAKHWQLTYLWVQVLETDNILLSLLEFKFKYIFTMTVYYRNITTFYLSYHMIEIKY